MYTSMLRIKESTVDSLCYASRLLQLDRVEKACCKFILNNLTPQNCLHYLQFGETHDYPQLRAKCLDHAAQNFAEVAHTPQFLELGTADLTGIIQSSKLSAQSQQDVLEATLLWVNKEPSTRQVELFPLLDSIKEHTFPLQEDENVQEILNSPKTNAENVVRSLKACFEKLHLKHEEKRRKERSESDSSGEPTPPTAGLKPQRKVHFQLEEDCDTPSKLPESEQQPQQQEVKCKKSRSEKNRHQKTSVIIAAGGITDQSNTSSVEKYDPKKGNWAAATALPQKKSHAALVSSGQKIYSIGGYNGTKRLSSVEVFSPQLGKWSNAAPMPTARSGFGAAVDSKGRIYCIGGYSGSQDLSDVDIYDPDLDKWIPGPRLNQRRSYVQAAAVGDSIYAVGGTEGNKRLHSVEKLSPTRGCWDHVADLNTARSRPGVSSLNGHIYAVGGYSGSEHLDSAECYSPTSDRWMTIESMSIPRNSPATTTHDGCLYVAGGHSGDAVLQSVECYDPKTKQWSGVSPMATARCDFGLATVEVPHPPREVRKEPQPVGTWI